MNADLRNDHARWVPLIRQALDEDRFTLFAQPAAPLSNEQLPRYVEVLVRLIEPDGKLVLPGAFLPAAERYHQIEHIDRWVAGYVFNAMREGLLLSREIVAINVSASSLTSAPFVQYLRQRILSDGLSGEQICFEIVASATAADLSAAAQAMRTLRELGCRFALDDFGMGLSVYSHLKQLPVDYIKIDGAFTKNLADDAVDIVIVESLQRIAEVMDIRTIAETVETDETKHQLSKLGVDYAQGYGIARPVPFQDCFATLA